MAATFADAPAVRAELVVGNPDEALVNLAETEGSDLIVIAAHSAEPGGGRLGTHRRAGDRARPRSRCSRSAIPRRGSRTPAAASRCGCCSASMTRRPAIWGSSGPRRCAIAAPSRSCSARSTTPTTPRPTTASRPRPSSIAIREIEALITRDLFRRFGGIAGPRHRARPPRSRPDRRPPPRAGRRGDRRRDRRRHRAEDRPRPARLGVLDHRPRRAPVGGVRATAGGGPDPDRADPARRAGRDRPVPVREPRGRLRVRDDATRRARFTSSTSSRTTSTAPTRPSSSASSARWPPPARRRPSTLTSSAATTRRPRSRSAPRAIGVDVICISSHGRSGITRALVGSVADRLLRATRLPVLVLRPA